MKKITSRIRGNSYISAVLALLMVIFGLLRLPRIGYQTIGGIFTIVWLGFALLILSSHLRILMPGEPAPSLSTQPVTVEQRKRIRRRMAQS